MPAFMDMATRPPKNEVEARIYDEGDTEAISLASYWLCEECADLWFSLDELGFHCISPNENMREIVKEYAENWVRKEES